METIRDETDARTLLQDNDVLFEKLQKNAGIDPVHAEMAMTEVLRFLSLIADSKGETLTPSILVDDAWHEFILCTRAYCDYCRERFGRYMHHHPGGKSAKHAEQFARTLELYTERHGTPSPRFWDSRFHSKGDEADCGSCEAD